MLVRTRPYRPTLAYRPFDSSFDRIVQQLSGATLTQSARTPVVDAAWRDGDLVLTVDLPGVSAEQVGVAVSGRTLTLSATTERATWERNLTIGAALDAESVTAQHVDGRLTVTIGAAAKPAVRTVEISTTAPAALEATTTGAVEGTDAVEAQPENGTSDNA
jgi:HSP20 family protein